MTFALTGMTALALGAASAEYARTTPFQGRAFVSVPNDAVALKKSACDGDPYNKCTFDISIDFDRDGVTDRAQMMNARGQGIIVVRFAKAGRRPMVVASFRSPFEGHDYIAVAKGRPDTISLVHPESSLAEIRLISGKPKIRWIGE